MCTSEQRCSPSSICVTDTPPTLTLEGPVEAMEIGTVTADVRGAAKDDADGLKVEVSVNSEPWTIVPLNADGAFAVKVTLPHSDGVAATVNLRATDSKGRQAKIVRNVKVDNVSPVCAISSPLNLSTINELGTVVVTMTASDGSLKLLNPRISTDGALTFVAPMGDSSNYTFGWGVQASNGGNHVLVFRVDDGAGHTCEATSLVTVDNVKPTVSFNGPDAGSLLGPAFFAAGGVLSGTVSDGPRMLKSVVLDFADGGSRAAVVQGNQWSISIAAPAGDDFKAETATVVATDLGDNVARATLGLTVDVVAPVIAVTSPAANAKLNAASFGAGNNVPLAWTLTDGDSQLSIGIALPDGGVQSSTVVTTSPTDNPKAYQPTLVATDRAGNSGTATVAFTVDRVAPTMVSSVPANNTRMHVGAISADFSEPMMGTGLTLVPAAAGVWTTPQKWTVPVVAKDSVYVASTGAVTDLHGNPVVPSSFRLHTETWVPVTGATLATGYSQVVWAVTDQEGVISMVAQDSATTSRWLELSSSSGAISAAPPFSYISKLLVGWRTVKADLSSWRIRGMTQIPPLPSTSFVVYRTGPLASLATQASALIPSPAFEAEGIGLAEFGFIRNGNYERGGRAAVPVALSNIDAIHLSGKRWEIVQYPSTGIKSQTFGCLQPFLGQPSVCEMRGEVVLPGGAPAAPPASAISSGCSVQQINDAAPVTTLIGWHDDSCGRNCFADSATPGFARQIVADPASEGNFFSVEGTGPYQVRKLALSATCTGTWVNVGAALTLATAPRLVVIRGNPGLIYADASGDVKFVTP